VPGFFDIRQNAYVFEQKLHFATSKQQINDQKSKLFAIRLNTTLVFIISLMEAGFVRTLIAGWNERKFAGANSSNPFRRA